MEEVIDMVLELLDGNLISPRSIFDVLDVVEESLGTDVRQYLEDYVEGGEPEEVSMDEHYVEVLENVADIAEEILRQKNRKETEYNAGRIINIVKREVGKIGKESV